MPVLVNRPPLVYDPIEIPGNLISISSATPRLLVQPEAKQLQFRERMRASLPNLSDMFRNQDLATVRMSEWRTEMVLALWNSHVFGAC